MTIWHFQKDGASKGPFSDEQLKAEPLAGGLFAIEVGEPGVAPARFAG